MYKTIPAVFIRRRGFLLKNRGSPLYRDADLWYDKLNYQICCICRKITAVRYR